MLPGGIMSNRYCRCNCCCSSSIWLVAELDDPDDPPPLDPDPLEPPADFPVDEDPDPDPMPMAWAIAAMAWQLYMLISGFIMAFIKSFELLFELELLEADDLEVEVPDDPDPELELLQPPMSCCCCCCNAAAWSKAMVLASPPYPPMPIKAAIWAICWAMALSAELEFLLELFRLDWAPPDDPTPLLQLWREDDTLEFVLDDADCCCLELELGKCCVELEDEPRQPDVRSTVAADVRGWWADGMDLEWLAGLTVTSTLFRDLESGEAILAAEVEPRFAATEDEELDWDFACSAM